MKTERESAESDEEAGSFSPTRENYYYDSYLTPESDAFREPFDYALKRSVEEPLSPTSSTNSALPPKRARGRPYKEASVKITCLRPEDRISNTLSVDFNKLQEEGLGTIFLHTWFFYFYQFKFCSHLHVTKQDVSTSQIVVMSWSWSCNMRR